MKHAVLVKLNNNSQITKLKLNTNTSFCVKIKLFLAHKFSTNFAQKIKF